MLSARLARCANSVLFKGNSCNIQPRRTRWWSKIKLEIYPCLAERLEEMDVTKADPELYKAVDIGLPQPSKLSRIQLSKQNRKQTQIPKRSELEKLARNRELIVDLERVQAEWEHTTGPHHLRTLAEHYGIFEHLFGGFAYFIPRVALSVLYEFDEDIVSPVYRGNIVKPKEARSEPIIQYASEPGDLWSLVLTNPDGNLVNSDSECLHWFVGNIRGNDVSSGEILCDYLQPFPPRGSGYHRYVFILYKQEGHIDFSQFKRQTPCLSLSERSFSTQDFYRQLEDHLTPAGLSWFQADWDSSLSDFFHNTLKMREPVYEYDFPKVYVAPEKHFPLTRQFDTYMDLHRDPKEINKDILIQRLKKLDPLKPEDPVLPFPAAQPIHKDTVTWLRRDIKKQRLGEGKYSGLYRGSNRPRL